MILYPAIDLIDGQCVRLTQGRFDQVTQYDEDPLARLQAFVEAGAEWVHIVDLDGARAGAPQQTALIARLVKSTSVKIQTGGGIRSRDHVKALLDVGVTSVVVGSVAVVAPDMVLEWIDEIGPERLTLALDVRPFNDDFEVAMHGWAAGSGQDLWSALDTYSDSAAKRIMVTDVSRDGLLQGPNFMLMHALITERPDLDIQASGGVRSVEDLIQLQTMKIGGAIVGKAIYEGLIDLKDAQLRLGHAG